MAQIMGPVRGETAACTSLVFEMIGYGDAVLPERIRRAVMDTVSADLPEVTSHPILGACIRGLSTRLFPR